jgi:hypothetical protein
MSPRETYPEHLPRRLLRRSLHRLSRISLVPLLPFRPRITGEGGAGTTLAVACETSYSAGVGGDVKGVKDLWGYGEETAWILFLGGEGGGRIG